MDRCQPPIAPPEPVLDRGRRSTRRACGTPRRRYDEERRHWFSTVRSFEARHLKPADASQPPRARTAGPDTGAPAAARCRPCIRGSHSLCDRRSDEAAGPPRARRARQRESARRVLAYPDKPSLLLPPACEVLELAGPAEDGIDAIERLADALEARSHEPVREPLSLPDPPAGAIRSPAWRQSSRPFSPKTPSSWTSPLPRGEDFSPRRARPARTTGSRTRVGRLVPGCRWPSGRRWRAPIARWSVWSPMAAACTPCKASGPWRASTST